MNPDTGHLAAMEDLVERYGSEAAARRHGYEPVPDGRLSRRAEKLLAAGNPVVSQSDPLTRAMKRVRALRKKAERQARKRGRR